MTGAPASLEDTLKAAARSLGINRTTLYKKLRRLGMDLTALEPSG